MALKKNSMRWVFQLGGGALSRHGTPMGPLRRLKYHLIEFFFSAITPSSAADSRSRCCSCGWMVTR